MAHRPRACPLAICGEGGAMVDVGCAVPHVLSSLSGMFCETQRHICRL
jgi:hypothetical protein